MLQHTGLGVFGLSAANLFGATSGSSAPAIAGSGGKAKAKAAAASAIKPLNRLPRMVHEYNIDRLREIAAAADRRRAALKSKQDAEAYVRDVRTKVQQCFGPWPEKTPLNARTTGVIERDAYRIEKVIFESRPGFPVTANLYIPKGRAFPLPGVVGSCGHSDDGKAAVPYQSFSQGLARQGYIVLIFDPIAQGERAESMAENGKPRLSVAAHLHSGNPQFLVDEFLGSWRAWDGIRALDYLLTRPEVDPKHVGITGNSGGGTMATWLWALDPRWTMGAPSCFVTTFLRNLENELPADTEQCPPHALALGLDHSDFVAAFAPKPIMILGQERDFFDARGLEEAYAQLRPLYKLFGAEENIALFIGPNVHGYSQPNREAMYGWFNRITNVSEGQAEPPLVIESPETLWCIPGGQVAALHPKTVYSFTRDASRALATRRGAVTGAALSRAVQDVLKLPAREGVPDYRILRPLRSRKHPAPYAANYMVETEPDVFTVVYQLHDVSWTSRPPRGTKEAILYVSHRSADAELRDEPLLAEIIAAEPKAAVFACDVRGIGESEPNTADKPAEHPYGSDFMYAIHGVMLDAPYPRQKTHDLLRVIDWMNAYGYEAVHLVAKGWGAIPGTFAALLSKQVTKVTLKHALTSYSDIAEAADNRWPLSAMPPGVLKHFDLPDCYRALAAKNLRQVEPWGAADGGA